MKSLEELIEEIKREARGEPPPEDPFSHEGFEDELAWAYAEEDELAWAHLETEPPIEPEPPLEPEPPIEPEPPLEPEPPIVEPRPPMPDEPEEPEDDEDDLSPIRESDFDVLAELDLDFERPEPFEPAASVMLAHPSPNAPPFDAPAASEEALAEEPLREPVPETRFRPGLSRPLRVAIPALGLLVLLVGAALMLFSGPDREAQTPTTNPSLGVSGEQDVVAWSVWDGETTEGAFVTVVAVGGGKPAVALVIPAYTIVNIPGYGDGTVGDAIAAAGEDRGAAAVENILGVGVDASAFSTMGELARIIDQLGGVSLADRTMTGEEAVAYLMRGAGDSPISAEFQFLRWQELVVAMLDAINGRTEIFGALGTEVAPVLAAAGSAGAEVLELPVVDIGAGLAHPDAEEVQRIVAQRFVPTARTTRTVRLSVLNGVGVPGVGDRVWRILGPAGFRQVVAGNAQSFDVKETQIIATSEEFLPEAELARELLGVGKVYVGVQPSGLVDVTVIVGADFGGS